MVASVFFRLTPRSVATRIWNLSAFFLPRRTMFFLPSYFLFLLVYCSFRSFCPPLLVLVPFLYALMLRVVPYQSLAAWIVYKYMCVYVRTPRCNNAVFPQTGQRLLCFRSLIEVVCLLVVWCYTRKLSKTVRSSLGHAISTKGEPQGRCLTAIHLEF